jgi:hypothetical protein
MFAMINKYYYYSVYVYRLYMGVRPYGVINTIAVMIFDIEDFMYSFLWSSSEY